ncbi:MAG: ureidoglycolate lyase [Gammaproteobacteria bacterium]|nr:ureidoglycolate lyase [Gammaproteobacteria bacterium]
MSNHRTVRPEPLTAAAFSPFGEVLSAAGAQDVHLINDGHTQRFHDLARLDLNREHGQPLVSVFRSTPLPPPLLIESLERHPLSSQTFFPLSARPYLVIVAPPGPFDPAATKVFLAAPDQGVNYAAGTWHHYSLALQAESDFLVIDRGGPQANCDTVTLAPDDRFYVDPD